MQPMLTGHMDSRMAEDVTTALERFSGREVDGMIEIPQHASATAPDFHSGENR